MLKDPGDIEARGGMLIGAHFGGLAIENSMLGATHACAVPLTAHYPLPHGVAIALLLSHVVDWNMAAAREHYEELNANDLARRLRELSVKAELPQSLREASIPKEALPRLAEEAGSQWTGRFNPRHFDTAAALEIYESVY